MKKSTKKTEKAQSPEVGFLGLSSINETTDTDINGLAREEGEEGVFIASEFLNGDIPSDPRNEEVPSDVSKLSDGWLSVKENPVISKKNRGQD